MDRNAADLVLHEFALPCMKPRADLEAELANAVPNRTRAPNSPCRPVEGREESVAGRIHFPSAEVPQLRSDESMVLLNELPPPAIAELGRAGGGIDEIGEQDRRQDAVRAGLPSTVLC